MADPIVTPAVPTTPAPPAAPPAPVISGNPAGKPDSQPAAAGKLPDAPLSDANPAAKSRAISREIAEKKKAAAAERRATEAEAALQAERAKAADVASKLDKLKADPLGGLEALGLTYEEITKLAIKRHGANTQAARLEAIESTLKSQQAAQEKAAKDAAEKIRQQDVQAKITAYVADVHTQATKDADAYELVNALDPEYAKALIFDVADELAGRTRKTPDAKEVLGLIETYLEGEALKYAGTKKVKAKLAPAAPEAAKPAATPAVQAAIDAKLAKDKRAAPATLTNKLAAAPVEKAEAPKYQSRQDALRAAAQTLREARQKNSA